MVVVFRGVGLFVIAVPEEWQLMAYAPHEDDNAGKDERDAQQLAHIERHACLKVHLVVLDEFDEEAQGEECYQEDAED